MTTSDSISGSWTGRYDYDNVAFGAPVSFDAVLTQTAGAVRGEVVEPNTFRPESTDTLLAVLTGTRSGSSVHMVKIYTDFDENDHPVYEGQINSTATRITGRWYFPKTPGVKGTFLLARTTHAAARTSTSTSVEIAFDM